MNKTKTTFLIIGIISSLTGSLSLPSYAATITESIDPNLFGNLDQGKTNCPFLGCGPTAFTNSLAYLQTKFKNIYGELLIPDTNNNDTIDEAEMISVANDISQNYMKNCSNNVCSSTKIEDFIIGKTNYIESKVPEKTNYKAQIGIEWGFQPPHNNDIGTKPDFVQDQTIATLDFIAKEIKEEEDLEIFIGNNTGLMGVAHYLTVTGISYDDTNNTGTISLIDPLGGVQITKNIVGLSNGFIELDYQLNGQNTFVAHAVSESPKLPEPSAMAGLLMLGIIGTASTLKRKQKVSNKQLEKES